MDLSFYIFLFVSGLITGVFSGLLGIGGALIIIPILLYLPPILGLNVISMHVITGITAMQTTFGTLAASYFHSKTGNVSKKLAIYVGTGIAIGALSGAILSRYLSEIILLWIYAFFMASAAVLLLMRAKKTTDENSVESIKAPKFKCIFFGLIIGLPSGALGFAGSVIVIPLLNTVFDVPLRICISTCTHIAFIASLMSFIGKVSTGQIHFVSAVIISVSAFVGASLGSELNKRANPKMLKYFLLFLILLTLCKVIWDIVVRS